VFIFGVDGLSGITIYFTDIRLIIYPYGVFHKADSLSSCTNYYALTCIMRLMLIALIILLFISGGFALGAVLGAPWVPAFKKDLKAMIDDTNLKPGEVFYELGCGDGRLVVEAAKRGAKAVGYEISPVMWLIAKIRVTPCRGASVKFGDFWRLDLSSADVVLAFLVPRTIGRLEVKAAKEMKPGARLVSYIFPFPNMKPKTKAKNWSVYEY
jgi:SAM-dependent methyltransferase